MPLTHHQTQAILTRRAKGLSIAVIASQLKIGRDAIRGVINSGAISERHGFTSELLPGIRQMSDADADIARQPANERDEQHVSEQVWSIAADIRAAAIEKRKREVTVQYA